MHVVILEARQHVDNELQFFATMFLRLAIKGGRVCVCRKVGKRVEFRWFNSSRDTHTGEGGLIWHVTVWPATSSSSLRGVMSEQVHMEIIPPRAVVVGGCVMSILQTCFAQM